MKISIEHVTRYAYAAEANYCVQSLRLPPSSFDGHTVVAWQTTVEPAGETTPTRDAFGNVVLLATVSAPHREILIRTGGTVDVENRNGIVTGLSDTVPLRVFLRQTPLTLPDARITDVAQATAGLMPIPRLHAMMNLIRDRVDYRSGATHATTTAAEAMASRSGVCQDHAHIFISAACVAGIPARYVTGYLLLENGTEADAHHAWAEAWVDGLGWIAFDVANRICPTDRYVRLTAALDAHFAAPVRGSRRSAGPERLEVGVVVQADSLEQVQSQQ